MKKYIKLVVFLVILIILTLLTIYYRDIIDEKVYSFISQFINPTNTKIAKAFSILGGTPMVIFLLVLGIIFFKKKSFSTVISVATATIISQILKRVVRRNRPSGISIMTEKGFSFPSGHSMVNAAFYGLVIYLIYQSKIKCFWKTILISVLTLIILLIGISRIYLGVHYPTDVICGYLLAIIQLVILVKFVYKRNI